MEIDHIKNLRNSKISLEEYRDTLQWSSLQGQTATIPDSAIQQHFADKTNKTSTPKTPFPRKKKKKKTGAAEYTMKNEESVNRLYRTTRIATT